MVKGYHGKKTGIPPGATMKIEGEFDPIALIMSIIAVGLAVLTMAMILPYISGVVSSGLCACP